MHCTNKWKYWIWRRRNNIPKINKKEKKHQKWEKGETLIDEDGEEYIDSIEKRLPLPKELLDYVITLDPEEVKLRWN